MSEEKKFLRITQPGMTLYNGPMSVYNFVDGISTEAINREGRDRISANFACVEIGEDGKEQVAGVSERLVTESISRAVVRTATLRQTEEEKVDEEITRAKKDIGGDLKVIHTEDQLDAIIDKQGIAGLREIAAQWNVKNRSIPTLRQMILDEQEVYQSKEGGRMSKLEAAIGGIEGAAKKTEEGRLAKTDVQAAEEVTENTPEKRAAKATKSAKATKAVKTAKTDIEKAAMTGDMAAAVSQATTSQGSDDRTEEEKAEDAADAEGPGAVPEMKPADEFGIPEDDDGDLDIDTDPFAKPKSEGAE